jgi:hypothetical protein
VFDVTLDGMDAEKQIAYIEWDYFDSLPRFSSPPVRFGNILAMRQR